MAGQSILDGQPFDLPCPNCGRKTTKTVGWVKRHSQFTCTCGTVVTLEKSSFLKGIGDAERSIDRFKRNIRRNFPKEIKINL